MNLNSFKALTALVLSIFFTISCEENKIQIDQSDSGSKRLNFSTTTEFESAIEQLKVDNKLFEQQKHFRSFASAVNSLKSSSTESLNELDTLIMSDIFKSIINNEAEVEVAGIIYKVTVDGTFYTKSDNYDRLLDYLSKDFNINDFEQTNSNLLKSSTSIATREYQSISEPDIYYVDSFERIEEEYPSDGGYYGGGSGGGSGTGSTSTIPEPKDSDFKVSSYKGTVVGKWWDDLWGFAISIRHYFDSRNRMDAKFYAQRYAVYSEAGIKTKTQYKGWTGIWRKKDCDEIRSGYEVMILTQEWSKNIVPSPVDPTSKWPYNTPAPNTLKTDYGDLSFVGRGYSYFKNKTYDTFSFIGKDIDLTKKDVLNAVYKALLASQSMLPDESEEKIFRDKTAIQLIDPWQSLRKSTFVGLNHEKIGKNTDKVTYIIEKDWGFQIGYSASLDNLLSWSNFKIPNGESPKLTFQEGTRLYGVARKGTKWKGVRYVFTED